ncbi:MAG: histidine kinase [Cytophagales bacterium]
MNKLFIHNPFFRLLSGLVVGVMVYLLILLINNTLENVNTIFNNEELYVCIGLSYLSFESMRWVIVLVKQFQSLRGNSRLILIQTAATLAISLLLVAVAISLYFKYLLGFSIGSSELNLFLIIYFFAGLLYNLLYFSQYYLQLENKELITQETKLREKIDADFFSFRNDINPDLLYESLENLILSIHHDSYGAEEQIDYLAGVYRYTLVNRHKELVSYADELGSAKNLLALLNFKYQNCLQLKSNVRDEHHLHLIPGSLMITIDAIVRNTLISEKSPMVISIYEEDEYVVLQHQLNEKLVLHTASLDSFLRLQRSYSFFSDNTFVQVKAGNQNYVKFPAIGVSQTVQETV